MSLRVAAPACSPVYYSHLTLHLGRVFARKKLSGGLKKQTKTFFLSGNNPLMSFKHLKMLNSASKCLKIPLNVKV
jgi:hypothetical protein